jgi:hypothetical protein
MITRFNLEEDYSYGNKWQIKKFAYAVKQICSILTGITVKDFEKEEIKSSILGEEWRYYEDGVEQYYTTRSLLQRVGTDAMRDVIHPDVWVNALMKDYRPLSKEPSRHSVFGNYSCTCSKCNRRFGSYWKHQSLCEECYNLLDITYPNWIITDVRFPNEAKAIKDRDGILIRVNREDARKFIVSTGIEGLEKLTQMLPKEHESETALDNYDKFDYVIENDSDIPSLIEKVKEMLIHFKIE